MVAHGDGFGVGQRLGGADQFGADLVELALAPALGAFVAEHRAGVKDALRQALGEAVGDQRAGDAGGAFGAEGEAVAAAVLEAVHFLGDDIGGFAQGAGEDGGVFKDRGLPFLKPVKRRDAACGVDDVGVAALILADQILGPTHRLQSRHIFTPKIEGRRIAPPQNWQSFFASF